LKSIENNTWEPKKEENLPEIKKELTSEEKIKLIIKSYLELHSKIVENSPGDNAVELFNLCQHIFSFEDEMNQ